MPTAAVGAICEVANIGQSTIGLVGAVSGQSIVSAATTALATVNASGSALNLICDGTNWWKQAV